MTAKVTREKVQCWLIKGKRIIKSKNERMIEKEIMFEEGLNEI